MVAIAPGRPSPVVHSLYADDLGVNPSVLRDRISGIGVDVTGTPVSSGRRRFLEDEYRYAKVTCDLAAQRRGLFIEDHANDELRLEPFEPDRRGLIRGYNDGNRIGLNSYVVAGTELYRSFRGWLDCKGGKFGRYLRGMFGTRDSADNAAMDTIRHEYTHKLQLKPLRTSDGRVVKPFKNALFQVLNKRYHDALPKGMKWLSPLAAHFTSVPVLEGLNETVKENVYEGKSACQIRRERSRGVTTYDAYTAPVAGALDRLYGGRGNIGSEGVSFYGDYARRGDRAINRLLNHTVFAPHMRN
jgi:hypothetical protein